MSDNGRDPPDAEHPPAGQAGGVASVIGTDSPEHTTGGYFAKIPETVLYDERLSSNAVRVFGVLARHADDAGVCWPGQERVARLANLGRRATQMAIDNLAAVGYVAVERRGRTMTNVYRLMRTERASPRSDAHQTCLGCAPEEPLDAHETCANESHETESLNESHLSSARGHSDTAAGDVGEERGREGRIDDEVVQALVGALKLTPARMTQTQRDDLASNARQLVDAGATPALIHQAVAAWQDWLDWDHTPTAKALVKNWSTLLDAIDDAGSYLPPFGDTPQRRTPDPECGVCRGDGAYRSDGAEFECNCVWKEAS